MKQETKATLEAVIHTLDCVTVSGEKNLDMMLGCIRVLRKLLTEGAEDNG